MSRCAFRPEEEAVALRREHRATVFVGGLIIAGVLAVPILDLTAPLFATACMTHVHKRLASAADRAPEQRPLQA